jgi:peptidoglycan hydrolase-like protein with peptidoglycan-binding domain
LIELGNPKLKSFRATFIRRVLVDEARVLVHREIFAPTEELLCRAVERGVIFSKDGLPVNLNGYDPEGSESQIYGLSVEIPTDKDLTGIGDGIGFIQEGNMFTYQPDATIEELPSFDDETPTAIGSRQLKIGLQGKDVKFVNLYIGLNDEQDQFTRATEEGVRYLQQRLGIPETGEFDWYTWKSVIPRQNFRLAGGHAGPKVRALQAALRCFGFNPPVTSRFGNETIRSVREFQVANNLRVTGRVGLPEWAILFDYH